MLLDRQRLSAAPFCNALGKLFGVPRIETKSADRLHAEPAPHRPHPMRARRTTGDRLREALIKLSGQCATCAKHEEKAWSSITFSGTRHEVTLRFEGAEAVAHGEEFMEILPEHEFTIPGQLVADATIREVDHRFGMHERLEVTAVLLLLEES
ncbi:MAG: hypothetical protein AAFY42_09150 [Pseudomonadota bacterium]